MMKIDKSFLLSSSESTIEHFGQLATELEKQELDASTILSIYFISH